MNRPSRRGFSVVELLVVFTIVSVLMTACLSVTSLSLRAADKTATENGLSGSGRMALDETLFQLRGADQVIAAATLDGAARATGATGVVLASPGYDPANPAFYLGGVRDYAALRYDPARRVLLETLVPGSGSVRPFRSDYVLARNVAACTFTYRARDQFSATATGNVNFTLAATPTATPAAYVNGAPTTCVWNSGSRVATVYAPTRNSDVQFVYPVNPAAGADTLGRVGEVEITLQLLEPDGRRISRDVTVTGAARLRNWRN
jgi:prepilin-type N-terminal cleavage/methylation domain-containing protein